MSSAVGLAISARPSPPMHIRLSGRTSTGARRQEGSSVAVRGIADGAHRPSWRPGRRPLNVRGPPPSAMRPCAPGLSHGRGRKTHGRGDSSGYADRPSGFLPLAWHFRMPARCLRRRVLVCLGVLRASVIRLSRRQPARRGSGCRSSAGPRRRARPGRRPLWPALLSSATPHRAKRTNPRRGAAFTAA